MFSFPFLPMTYFFPAEAVPALWSYPSNSSLRVGLIKQSPSCQATSSHNAYAQEQLLLQSLCPAASSSSRTEPKRIFVEVCGLSSGLSVDNTEDLEPSQGCQGQSQLCPKCYRACPYRRQLSFCRQHKYQGSTIEPRRSKAFLQARGIAAYSCLSSGSFRI